ncbi:hypothetical protein ACLOJK_038732 [Asimina triloba]
MDAFRVRWKIAQLRAPLEESKKFKACFKCCKDSQVPCSIGMKICKAFKPRMGYIYPICRGPVSMRLRSLALREEMVAADSDNKATLTLLGLAKTLSSLCSGAEFLLQVVKGAIPSSYFDAETAMPPGEIAVHILNHIYKQLDEICPVRGGEEEPYHMLLMLFVESLLPYIKGLDSWLYDGTLDDPFEEPAFWEKSYLLRHLQPGILGSGISRINDDSDSTKNNRGEAGDRETISLPSYGGGKHQNDVDNVVCPVFLKHMARAIVSAGKSLQLMRHVPMKNMEIPDRVDDWGTQFSHISECVVSGSQLSIDRQEVIVRNGDSKFIDLEDPGSKDRDCFHDVSNTYSEDMHHAQGMGGLTLSEVFCVSLVGLIEDGCHVFKYFEEEHPCNPKIAKICKSYMEPPQLQNEAIHAMISQKIWYRFLVDPVVQRSNQVGFEPVKDCGFVSEIKELSKVVNFYLQKLKTDSGCLDEIHTVHSFCPENPAITVCKELLLKNKGSWNELNLSRNFHLPPLDDDDLRRAIFGENQSNADKEFKGLTEGTLMATNYTFGFQFCKAQHLRSEDEIRTIEGRNSVTPRSDYPSERNGKVLKGSDSTAIHPRVIIHYLYNLKGSGSEAICPRVIIHHLYNLKGSGSEAICPRVVIHHLHNLKGSGSEAIRPRVTISHHHKSLI